MAVEAIAGTAAIVDSCTFRGNGDGGGTAVYGGGGSINVTNSLVIDCDVKMDDYCVGGVSNTEFRVSALGGVARVVIDDTGQATVSGCRFNGGTGAKILAGSSGTEWNNVVIDGNVFTGGWIDAGSGLVEGLVVSDNVLDGDGTFALTYDASTAARTLHDINISGNVSSNSFADPDTRIHLLGSNLALENVTIDSNVLVSSDPSTGVSLIDLQTTRQVADSGQGIRVTNNLLEHFAGVGAYALRVRGSTGGYGHVVVDGNTFRAAGIGTLISNIRDVVVTNNVQGITSDTTSSNASHSNQLTVSGSVSAIVDGNRWIAGEAGDPAGTNSVIYVQASGSGVVRNNDVWGREVGSTGLNTVISYSTTLAELGNVYHGLHTSQSGSTFTNEFVTI